MTAAPNPGNTKPPRNPPDTIAALTMQLRRQRTTELRLSISDLIA
jgi:hypothetical protein